MMINVHIRSNIFYCDTAVVKTYYLFSKGMRTTRAWRVSCDLFFFSHILHVTQEIAGQNEFVGRGYSCFLVRL